MLFFISTDFVAVMLFSQQAFHLGCLFIYSFIFFGLLLILLEIIIISEKSQPGVAYKCIFYERSM